MKDKITLILLTIMLLVLCAGCEGHTSQKDGDELLANSKATGSVIDFFDGGCEITPTFTDGDVAYEAAPGCEKEDDVINVLYSDDCIFRIVYVNIQTGSAEYKDATTENIKKQTRLVIYGNYDNDDVLIATHVYIYRSVG